MRAFIALLILLVASLASASNYPLERKAGAFDTGDTVGGYGCSHGVNTAYTGPSSGWEVVWCGLTEDYFIIRAQKLPSDAVAWKFAMEGFASAKDADNICYEVRAVAIPPGSDLDINGFPITDPSYVDMEDEITSVGLLYRSGWTSSLTIKNFLTDSPCSGTDCDYAEVNIGVLRVECPTDDLGAAPARHNIRRILIDTNP